MLITPAHVQTDVAESESDRLKNDTIALRDPRKGIDIPHATTEKGVDDIVAQTMTTMKMTDPLDFSHMSIQP